MRVLLCSPTGTKVVDGIPIKVGILDKHFAVTPCWLSSKFLVENRYNVTHIPSGCCYAAWAKSAKAAKAMFEEKILQIGKTRYQKVIRQAMKKRLEQEKQHPEWFKE